MTYSDKEYSVDSGEPFELYDFTRIDWQLYLTSRTESLEVSEDRVYKPSPIKRSKIQQNKWPRKEEVVLIVPKTADIAQEFMTAAPEVTTAVTIRRLHRGLSFSESVVMWKGRVAGAEAKGEQVEISCESFYTAIQQVGLREKTEFVCQNVLYGSSCNVNQPSFRFDDDIASVDGTNITMSTVDANFVDGWFSGGILEHPNGRRMILSHSGDNLEISRPLTFLSAGVEVALYPGCDHRFSTCLNKFDNTINFKGFPWIPSRNPFTKSIV